MQHVNYQDMYGYADVIITENKLFLIFSKQC